MIVSPRNYHQLVDQETNIDLQLDSCKNLLSRRCASFVCLSRASIGVDGCSPLKVGLAQPGDIVPSVPAIKKDKELVTIVDNDNSARNIPLKSCMKKSKPNSLQIVYNRNEQERRVKDGDDPKALKERKVQWTDTCGKELTEIREFDQSECGESDGEFFYGNRNTCSCTVM